MAALADRAAAAVLKGRLARKRAAGWAVPPPEPSPPPDPAPDQTADLRIDLWDAVARLPPRLRDTLAAVERSATATAAARRLGVSRAEVHRRLADARDRLGKAGVREYAGNGRDTSGPFGQGTRVAENTPEGDV